MIFSLDAFHALSSTGEYSIKDEKIKPWKIKNPSPIFFSGRWGIEFFAGNELSWNDARTFAAKSAYMHLKT
jgi:hypothetical protein